MAARSKKTDTTTKTATARTPKRTSAAKRTTKKEEVFSPVETTTTTETTSTGRTLNLRRSKLFYTLLAVAILGFLLYAASKILVVAWVDNKPVTRFTLLSTLEKKYGKDTREQIIAENLIRNEAKNRKVTVSKDELNAEVQKIETDQGGADKLNQILEVQGISRDEFTHLVELQVLKQKLFGADVNVTDDDVNKYIEENKASLAANGVVDDKTKSSIKEELKQQKINENFSKWLQEALQSKRVRRV